MKTKEELDQMAAITLAAITGNPMSYIKYVMSDEWRLRVPFIYVQEKKDA